MIFQNSTIRPALFVAILSLILSGCNQQSVEEAADEAAEAVQSAGNAAKEMGDKLGEEFSGAAEKAAAALEGVEGGGEFLTGFKTLFASAQESLQGITDQASAEAASAKLDELSGQVQSLAGQAGQLPDEAKTAIQDVVKQAVEQLKALVDKVLTMPGVKDAIGPKLNELLDKLSSITGQ